MTGRKTTLITDFDNTLYDWFHMWHQSFGAMLGEIERISGIERAVLIPEIRAIHQHYGTSEYAFLIERIPSIQKKFQGKALTEIFDEAIHAYRHARNESLRLYDGVIRDQARKNSGGQRRIGCTFARQCAPP
jgi:FMN phosphatase YigB (HAD superfamily)